MVAVPKNVTVTLSLHRTRIFSICTLEVYEEILKADYVYCIIHFNGPYFDLYVDLKTLKVSVR